MLRKILHKSLILSVVLIYYFLPNVQAQVGIGTTSPNAAAALDINSTTRGLLHPRMTITQRNAILNPVAGLSVWCSDCGNYGELQVYNGITWTNMVGGAASVGFTCGTSTVTFTYNGSTVTYGTVISTGSKCWLDRNLGASRVATSTTDTASYGHLFQWGRLADGHQIRTSSTTANQSGSVVPGNSNFITATFVWLTSQNDTLWNGVNGVNNPCPSGFRLPTSAEFDAERASWGTNLNATGAFASPLKLPYTAMRNNSNGTIFNTSFGFYWSSTPINNSYQAYSNYFNSSNSIKANYDRALGLAVRCIKN